MERERGCRERGENVTYRLYARMPILHVGIRYEAVISTGDRSSRALCLG